MACEVTIAEIPCYTYPPPLEMQHCLVVRNKVCTLLYLIIIVPYCSMYVNHNNMYATSAAVPNPSLMTVAHVCSCCVWTLRQLHALRYLARYRVILRWRMAMSP